MTLEIAVVFALLIAALAIFAQDRFPVDFVALGIMAVILVLGPFLGVPPEDAISGFSNPATITVLAMFILSGGIYRTGVINVLARRAIPLAGGSYTRQLLTVMLLVGPVSMFINNTAAVAILIPLVLQLARDHRRPPSKLLIPLSFTSQLAGVVTLIGTSTNILASSLTASAGIGAFGMFEVSKIGLLVLATGAVYLLTVGRVLLPERRTEAEMADSYRVREYMTEVRVLDNSPLVGRTLIESRLSEEFDVHVLEVRRGNQKIGALLGDFRLRALDVLLIRASSHEFFNARELERLALEFVGVPKGQPADTEKIGLVEVVLGPNSDLLGGTLESTHFRNRFSCNVIAMQQRGKLVQERIAKARMRFGDMLLIQGEPSALARVKREPGLIVTETVDLKTFRREKIPVAVAIVTGVVLVAALGIQPILVTALVGCVLMVASGCLTMTELHESVRWDVIFLLAGVIPLGLAMERSGGAEWLADVAVRWSHGAEPIVILFIFYAMTMLLTELISNNASVVVMVPVAIATAQALGLDPKAVVVAVMFAASTSFSTPVGYQTNTMVYGPGGYRFLDYLRVGGPLNLLLAIVTPLFIYVLWGL